MPAAREALLDAAALAVGERPWSAVRMVDVARAAGVSRQTLYNEFGSKDGLARALLCREVDAFLRGVERIAALPGDTVADRLVPLAEWTVDRLTARPLLRGLLTGCRDTALPAPPPLPDGPTGRTVPARRRADGGPPDPAGLLAAVRRRSLAAVARAGRQQSGAGGAEAVPYGLPVRCELAVRLALSYAIAPTGDGVGALVRTAFGAGEPGVSGPSRRAGGR